MSTPNTADSTVERERPRAMNLYSAAGMDVVARSLMRTIRGARISFRDFHTLSLFPSSLVAPTDSLAINTLSSSK